MEEGIIMPGFTTHYIFGMKAYNDMPNSQLKHIVAKYRWLYQLGLQGPDIFFYNIPILRHQITGMSVLTCMNIRSASFSTAACAISA